MGNSPNSNEEKFFKRSVLIVSCFAAFLIPFMSSAINLALPSIGRDLNTNAVGLGWIASSFILSSAIFLLPFGRVADIVGRKKIFGIGILIFTISTFLIIFSQSITYLITLRAVQGMAGAMMYGTSTAIITSVFGPGERGRAMGINITFVYVGLSTGPVIGGLLTENFGWRSIFAFVVPFSIASLVLMYTKMKGEWADSKGERFDWKGSILYGLSVALFMYGFSKLPAPEGWIMLASGIIIAGLFLFFEKKIQYPVFDISLLLRNRVFAFSGLAALIHYSATSATGFFLSLYLQYIHGLDARAAGLIMISQPVAMALLSPVAGRLSDRFDPGIIASSGMALTATGLIALCFIGATTPHGVFVLLLILIGVGFALFSAPNSNAIMSSVEKRHLGVASGVVGTMRMIGQMMSMGIALMILSVYVGKAQITPENHSSLLAGMRTGFIIFSALCIAGIFASLARNNRQGKGLSKK